MTGRYKAPRGKHRQNILLHKSKQYIFGFVASNNGGKKTKNKQIGPN